MRAALVTTLMILSTGCFRSSGNPCGPGGHAVRGTVGLVCAYAVVEGGFLCPTDLEQSFELPEGERICAPSGTSREALPVQACRYLGYEDCSEARTSEVEVDRDRDGGLVADAGSTETSEVSPDAGVSIDASPAACDAVDALRATEWEGETPFGGGFYGRVWKFEASDCITFSRAWLTLFAGPDELAISFTYPVTSGEGGRSVAGTFEREASVTWTQEDGTRMEVSSRIRVVVTTWAEHASDPMGHEIDATITFLDPSFGSDPIVVRGHFCSWQWNIC